MSELTENEIEKAYISWKNQLGWHFDEALKPYLQLPKSKLKGECLRQTREALQLSRESVAQKLQITRSAVAQIELSEKNETLTLQGLCKYADAIDCELIYTLVPKTRLSFSEIIWKKLLSASKKHPWLRGHVIKREGPQPWQL